MQRFAQLYLTAGAATALNASHSVQALADFLIRLSPAGVTDVVPGYTTLHVEYDPDVTSERALRQLIDRADESAPVARSRTVEVPVVYDGADLRAVADAAGLTPAEVIARHSGPEYHAYAVGFAPGFAFLGDVDPVIRTPRLTRPRARVPAGAVGIADAQTGIYPLASPGGWNLVATATVAVYDPQRPEPALVRPGDRVRFVPVAGPATPPEPKPLVLLPHEPHTPAFRVQEPGLFSVVLDEGRLMAGRFGYVRSGPLDARSGRVANALLGNPRSAPLLEFSLLGPTLEALRDVVVAVTGGGVGFVVDGAPAARNTTLLVRRGQLLTFPPAREGARAYLAVAGGFESGTFMASACTDVRGLIGRPLAAGDVLGLERVTSPRAPRSFVPYSRRGGTLRLRLLPGPQYDEGTVAALASAPLRVLHSDRMGVRLGASSAVGGGVPSEGNPLGAVQLTADGHPLVLLNDRGSMGGYTKPALVDPRDLPALAQARDGTWVRFVQPGASRVSGSYSLIARGGRR